jgi:hypothetical protein
MKINRLNILTLLTILWIPAAGQQVKVDISLDTNVITIGDQTHLNLTVEAPDNLKLTWPLSQDTISKNIEILEHGEPDTTAAGDHLIKIKRRYLITSFDSGYFVIPPQKFIYNYQNDSVYDFAESQPLLLTVNTIPVDLTKDIKDIKDIMSEPLTFGEIVIRFVLPALAAAAIILFIIYYLRKRKKGEPVFRKPVKPLPPPDTEARAALDKLKEKKLWQNNLTKEYYSELTDIMRRYIERQLDFPAQEMTTAEITGSLKTLEIDSELIAATEEVLSLADLVKFAKHIPLGDENDAAMKWAYDFIERTSVKEETPEEEEKK